MFSIDGCCLILRIVTCFCTYGISDSVPSSDLLCDYVAVAVQSLSCVPLFVTPWTRLCCSPLSPRVCWNSCPVSWWCHPNYFIFHYPLFLLPSISPSIRVFSNELAFRIKWPKYWSFSISPSNEYSGLISFRIDWFDLPTVQGTLKSLTIWIFVSKMMSLLFNTLSRFVIAFLPRSKRLLISWRQSLSAVILEHKKIKSHCFHFFPIYLLWNSGTGTMFLQALEQKLFRSFGFKT